MMTITFSIPIRTVSEMNTREHWAKRAKRAKLHRRSAAGFMDSWMHGITGVAARTATKIRVTLTRIGKRKLDSDNLASSMKHAQDGIADAIGIDDGDDRMCWKYAQEIGKEYAVRVEMEFVV